MAEKITKDEMRLAFDLLALKLLHDNSEQKLTSVGAMLRLMSRYLRQEIDGIDTTAILLTLEELTNISQRGTPSFIRPSTKKSGRPQLTTENFQLASIAAAVEVLNADGMTVKDATRFVAERTGLSSSRVVQIRKEFREGKRQTKATEFFWDQIKAAQVSKISSEDAALNLITMSLIKRG